MANTVKIFFFNLIRGQVKNKYPSLSAANSHDMNRMKTAAFSQVCAKMHVSFYYSFHVLGSREVCCGFFENFLEQSRKF